MLRFATKSSLCRRYRPCCRHGSLTMTTTMMTSIDHMQRFKSTKPAVGEEEYEDNLVERDMRVSSFVDRRNEQRSPWRLSEQRHSPYNKAPMDAETAANIARQPAMTRSALNSTSQQVTINPSTVRSSESMKDVSALRALFDKTRMKQSRSQETPSQGTPLSNENTHRKQEAPIPRVTLSSYLSPSWRDGQSQATSRIPDGPRLPGVPQRHDNSRIREALRSQGVARKQEAARIQQAPPKQEPRVETLKSIPLPIRRPIPNEQPQPLWRQRPGAKEFRQNIDQRDRMRKEMSEDPSRTWVNRTRHPIVETRQKRPSEAQKKVKRQRRESQRQKAVTLPFHELNLTDLSSWFRIKVDVLRKTLRHLGENPGDDNNTYMVDVDMMELVALELGLEPTRSTRKQMLEETDFLMQRRALSESSEDVQYEMLPPRPPVVCLMGHVDHGKTTLMDALRQRSQAAPEKKQKLATTDSVAGTEAGGITQVISAFQVALENQSSAVTFLDTPGHAAFRSMRESGSSAADVIVLVVAADDGVSKQTVEIIDFYKSIIRESGGGGISMVVAMTKIDKPGINLDESRRRIENQLMQHGIVPESFGTAGEGEFGPPVQLIPVSGITGQGLDDLIDGLVLQSEVMDLRADVEARAEGIVMDARLDKGLGVVADCIVRWGSLQTGDIVVSGTHYGKVKLLKDVGGGSIDKALPSQPVRITGFKSVPKAGDPLICVTSEDFAKQLIERRKAKAATSDEPTDFRPEMEAGTIPLEITGMEAKQGSMLQKVRDKYGVTGDEETSGKRIRIPVVIKADADGTLAAVRESILAIGGESKHDLDIDPVSMGVGPICSDDVRMAKASGAAIFSFGVKQNDKFAMSLADSENVTVRCHDVIYSLLDDAKQVFVKYLPPVPYEHVHGKAVVRAVFDLNNKKRVERVAGLQVMDGSLYKSKVKNPSGRGSPMSCHYRVLRKGKQISPEGETLKACSLRKVKEDVEDVRRGDECGLGLEEYADFETGDVIECYSVEMKQVFI